MPLDERTKLRPAAGAVQTYFPRRNTGSGTRLVDLPQNLAALADTFDEFAEHFDRKRQLAVRDAQHALALNPNLSEEELVGIMGGHRVVAKRLVQQQRGVAAAQAFAARTKLAFLEDPVRNEGPEAVTAWFEQRRADAFATFPDDPDFRQGAAEAFGNLEGDIKSESILNEADNIIQNYEDSLGESVRQGILLDGAERTVADVREDIEAGRLAALPPERMRAAVIQTFINHAFEKENLSSAESVLRALVDGEDPFIKDPQERARVAEAIRAVRRAEFDQGRANVLSDAERRRQTSIYYQSRIGQSIYAGEPISEDDVTGLNNTLGVAEASRVIKSIRDNAGTVLTLGLDPKEVSRWEELVDSDQWDVTDITAAPDIPAPVKRQLIERSGKGGKDSIWQTPEYRVVRSTLGLDSLLPADAAVRDALAAEFARRVQIIAIEQPALLEPANKAKLFVALSQAAAEAQAGANKSVFDPQARSLGADASREEIIRAIQKREEQAAQAHQQPLPGDPGVPTEAAPRTLINDPAMDLFWTTDPLSLE